MRIGCVLFFVLAGIWCQSLFAQKGSTIYSIQYTSPFPLFDQQMKLTGYDTQCTNIHYLKDLIAYELPVYEQPGNPHSKKSTIIFVIQKDSSFGYYYIPRNPANAFNNKRYSVYKALEEESSIHQIYGYHAFRENTMKLLSVQEDKKVGLLQEKYRGYAKKDTSIQATCYYSYTSGPLQKVPFTLSRELDSIKGMKLFEIKIIHPGHFLKDYNITMDGFEQRYLLEEYKPANIEQIQGYFDSYSKEHLQRE